MSNLPAWIKIPYGVDHIASHGGNDGPLASQVPDDGGGDEHGGQDDGGEGHAVGGQAHAFISIQTALFKRENQDTSFMSNCVHPSQKKSFVPLIQ